MKTVLLTKESPFQIYCANELFHAGILDAVVIEGGTSIAAESVRSALTLAKLVKWLKPLALNPYRAVQTIYNLLHTDEYYGNRNYHDQRILNEGYRALSPDLPTAYFDDINSREAIDWVTGHKPDLVYVFGTRLIKQHVLDAIPIHFINMHWGWSPIYRGEGIVSALAVSGPKDLGVTVHLLDSGADTGDILYRDRPSIDKKDNLYSIGLKLTRLGTERFICAYRKISETGRLEGSAQNLSEGKLYSSAYMRDHPELYRRAWRNLLIEQERL